MAISWFIFGLFLGTLAGMVVMAACAMSRCADCEFKKGPLFIESGGKAVRDE